MGDARNFLKEFFITLNLSIGIFNDSVQKRYSSFYKISIINLTFTENMNESLLKIDNDRIIKCDH